MVLRWPRASRVDSPPAPDTDGRWGVARLVAQREAERRASATPHAPTSADPHARTSARCGPLTSSVRHPGSVKGPQRAREAGAREAGAREGDEAREGGEAREGDGLPEPRPPEPFEPPAPRSPVPRPPAPPRPLPAPRRPVGRIPGASDQRAPRPRIDPDPSLFGFARRTRGRLGARLFTLFFVLVFAVITVQTIVSMV